MLVENKLTKVTKVTEDDGEVAREALTKKDSKPFSCLCGYNGVMDDTITWESQPSDEDFNENGDNDYLKCPQCYSNV